MQWFKTLRAKREPASANLPQSPADAGRNRDESEGLSEPPTGPSREELMALVGSFSYWYQRINLGQGVYTMKDPAYHERVWDQARLSFPLDLKGASVLDVGCNAGYFPIQAKRLGAGHVLGIDHMDEFVKQAEACRRIWNLDIEYRTEDVSQISGLGEAFDIVIFAGILYHLKNPLQTIEDIGRVCKDAVLVETEIIPEDPRNCVYVRQGSFGKVSVTECRKGFMKFFEADELNGDASNWWAPDTECVRGMLRTAGFRYFSSPFYVIEGRLLIAASKKENSILNLKAI